MGSIPFSSANNKSTSNEVLFLLEQGTGIEPASEAWEATIIADIRTLHGDGIIAEGIGKFNHFLSMQMNGGGGAASLFYTIARIWCLGFAPTDCSMIWPSFKTINVGIVITR